MKKVKFIAWTAALAAAAALPLSPMSCRLSDEDGDEACCSVAENTPRIVSFRVVGADSVRIGFSKPVSLSELRFGPEGGGADAATAGGAGEEVAVALPSPTEVGRRYVISGVATDGDGNTADFSREFDGYNANPARLLLSEVRTSNGKPKPKFIELYALKGGNLFGFELMCGHAGEKVSFSFPDCEVSAGEYITVHTNIYDEDNSRDETGSNLSLSKATDSTTSRDLWYMPEKTTFLYKNDALFLRNKNSGEIVDCLIMGTLPKGAAALAEKLVPAELWTTGISSDGTVDTEDTTAARTVARLNVAELAQEYGGQDAIPSVIPVGNGDWSVVEKATPGFANSTAKYSKAQK